MSRPEDAAQIEIVDTLRRFGLWVVHVKNQGKWSARYGAQLNRMGRRKGMLDLMVLCEPCPKVPRGLVMIECKAPPEYLPSGKLSQAKMSLSKDQEIVAAELTARSIPVLLCCSAEGALTALRGLGVPLKGFAR